MSTRRKQFELTKQLEHLLASLSKLYARDGAKTKLELIVNAVARVEEEWSYDNLDGGTYGHAVHFALPASIFPEAMKEKTRLEVELKTDLNNIFTVQHEFVDRVFIEMVVAEDDDWRQESGVLAAARSQIPATALARVWGEPGFRLFLSHKAEVKVDAAKMKAALRTLGVSAFVAHEDIHPTKEWQPEMEGALASMEGFVALMTKDFHESHWTDQEVGYAVARGVPIIAVKLGRDPYGFIGKFQALSCQLDDAPKNIVKLLLKNPRMLDSYITAIESCPSFDAGNALAEVLPTVDQLSNTQAARIVAAYNGNNQVNGSHGFSGNRPYHYGDGLAVHLRRITGKQYRYSSGTLELAS